MGASNTAKVFVNWHDSGLTQREMLALVYMANISLDKDFPPVFFGDLQDLATAIGLNRGNASPESVRASVMKVLSGLRKAGAIVSSGLARTGIKANYALALDRETTFEPVGKGRNLTWKPVKRPMLSVAKKATQGVAKKATQGVANLATQPVAKLATPRNTQGLPRNNGDESNRLLDASLEGRISNFDLADEPQELSESEERNRQAAALQKLMAIEQQQTA